MKQVVLGQNTGRWSMNDDAGAARRLAENMLRHNYTQQLPNTIRSLQLERELSQKEIRAELDEGREQYIRSASAPSE